jgi:hypothetical protein
MNRISRIALRAAVRLGNPGCVIKTYQLSPCIMGHNGALWHFAVPAKCKYTSEINVDIFQETVLTVLA